MKRYNLLLMLLEGRSYTIRNVAKGWTYETSVGVDQDISTYTTTWSILGRTSRCTSLSSTWPVVLLCYCAIVLLYYTCVSSRHIRKCVTLLKLMTELKCQKKILEHLFLDIFL